MSYWKAQTKPKKAKGAWGDRANGSAPGATFAAPHDTPDNEHVLELERRIRRLTLSRDLTKEFVSTTNMQKLMGMIFERVLKAIEAEAGSLWMVDPRTRENVCHQAEGPAKDKVVGLRLPQGKGVVGNVIKTKHAEVVLDTASDDRFDAEVDKSSGFATRSMICVPLIVDGNVYGAIQVINKKSGFESRFTEDDHHLVEDLANSAAVSIKNARLLETESKVKEMGILLRISREITSTLDLDQVLGLVVNMTGELIEMKNGAVALLNEEKGRLGLAALSGEQEVDDKNASQEAMLNLMEKTLEAGRTVYVGDVEVMKTKSANSPWVAYLEGNGLQSVWATPLSDEEGKLGVLWFESDVPHLAEGGKSDLLTILANQTAVAVRNASLYHRVPFADTLGKVTEKGYRALSAWRKWAVAALLLAGILAGLQYAPFFKSVTADCEVESRLGWGVFLQAGGVITEIAAREGQSVDKGDIVARLDSDTFRLKFTQAMTQLQVLDRKIVEARAQGAAAEVRRLSAERAAVRAEANQARRDLQKVEVRAPRAGIVLTPNLNELVGTSLPPGAEILRIADPDKVSVVVHLPEEIVLDVTPGMEVTGVVRSAPDKRFTGTVTHVGRTYVLPPDAVQAKVAEEEGPAPPAFVAEVEVTATDVALRPGMTGKVRIDTPESSTLSRLLRRIKNFVVFQIGP